MRPVRRGSSAGRPRARCRAPQSSPEERNALRCYRTWLLTLPFELDMWEKNLRLVVVGRRASNTVSPLLFLWRSKSWNVPRARNSSNAGPKPRLPGAKTRAPKRAATSLVRSVEPVSTTTMSSTRSAAEPRQFGRFASSFLTIRHRETRGRWPLADGATGHSVGAGPVPRAPPWSPLN